MSTGERKGLHDPDDWIEWWLSLHPHQSFYGDLARLALLRLGEVVALGPGVDFLQIREGGEVLEVEVRYLVEDFPGRGRVFHVLSIRSPGDPLPPPLVE